MATDEEITVLRRTPPAPPEAGPVRPGTVLGHYRLESLIQRGASSEVFQGENLLARKPCVVKVFHAALVASRVRWGRYVHESKTVASLRQAGIVDVFNHQIVEGTGLAVMAPGRGSSLRDLLRGGGPLSRRAYLPIVRAIGLALAPVHAARLAHLRLHPGQVLVQWAGGDPVVELLDFGVHHLHRPLTEEVNGLPRTAEQAIWIAPEQAKGEPGDSRSDVYSLAVLLYQMITGRPPFVGETIKAVLDQHLSETPPPPSRFATLSTELEETLLRALEKDPRKRTQSVEALLAAIDPASVTGQHLLARSSGSGRPLGLAASASKEIELASLPVTGPEVLTGPDSLGGPVPPPLPASGQSGRVAVPVMPAPAAFPAAAGKLRVPRRWLWLVALAAAIAACGAVIAVLLLFSDEKTPPSRPPRRLPTAPGRTLPARRAPDPPRAARVAPAPGAAPSPAASAQPPAAAPPSRASAAQPAAPESQAAELEVVSSDPSAQVFVDGVPRGIGRNVKVGGLTPGRHRVRVIAGGKAAPDRLLLLKPGEHAKAVF